MSTTRKKIKERRVSCAVCNRVFIVKNYESLSERIRKHADKCWGPPGPNGLRHGSVVSKPILEE